MNLLSIVLTAVLGASLGSFFNVLIDRVPRGASIVKPPSHCNQCGKMIRPSRNIPILSYIILKGKCPDCGAKIHWYHLAVEIATPVLFLALLAVYGWQSFLFYKFVIMFGFLIPIFFIDAFHKIIPLVLSIPMLVFGLLLSLIQSGFDLLSFLLVNLLPAVVIFALLYLLAWGWEKAFHREGLGGGDVILIPAVAAYFGVVHIPWVIVLACLLGIVYFLLFIRKPRQVFAFGNFIASAAIIWALAGEQILSATGLQVF